MGGNYSTNVSNTSGNVNIGGPTTKSGTVIQPVIPCITVANAYSHSVRIYYSSAKMATSSLIQGNSLLSPPGVNDILLSSMNHINCPVNDDLYGTVFKITTDMPFSCPDGKPLFKNYQVEKHSSLLLTDGGVKFAKQGEIWIDEEGTNYQPGGDKGC